MSLDALIERMAVYTAPERLEMVKNAYAFAREKHEGQKRASGEPYFLHCFAVATILASLNADPDMVAAGLLHDTVEDTGVTLEDLATRFNPSVATLVDAVTKLGKLNFTSKEERQAENFRRMFLAMAKDIRVIVVKLCDRLHNMRTLGHLPESKQRDIAKETIEIFAPLAHRLGIGRIKWELEDESLRYLNPAAYKQVAEFVAEKRDEREKIIADIIARLQEELTELNVPSEISGRPKHFYSIYQKMVQQQKEFHELYDVTAIRVKVESEKECYEVLGVVHSQWRPIPGRFKDYIAMPKPNLYRSLHTAVIGPTGRPVEVQIRTHEMHRLAEYGIAAHWLYKEGRGRQSSADLQLSWLRQLLEWQNDLKDAQEYLDTVKVDLFADEVFVFTPRGDVFDLPVGATPVDFAYRIHTDVGHRCVGAKINGRIVPLNTHLHNGDIIEVMTSKIKQPKLDWVNFVATSQSKNRIRQWFKKERRDDNIRRGKELLEAEMGRAPLDLLLKSEKMVEMAQKLRQPNVEDLLAAIGYGEVTPNQVISRLTAEQNLHAVKLPPEKMTGASLATKSTHGLLVGGESGLLVNFSKCCSALPGEPIIGLVTRGRGVSVHQVDCANLASIEPERLVTVTWGNIEREHSYPVELEISCIDRMGLLKDILGKLSDAKVNIRAANVSTHKDRTATILLVVDITDLDHLKRIQGMITRISDVLSVSRLQHTVKKEVDGDVPN
ncbi:MAG: bifunctional (p)ppGpp synthetase/guanosine-3',5'-bis(diphosphate) 3'-pyrophosphohydrolase [Candidatus Sericytochromatia bacterium]|nr:bifunctional (p)ppGpp synthetase/guanosine-3',5'-bis(diphosphate) 3'-pyrophosphohydrolase [Candidatus Sericytochromatia bacterium]